MKSVYIAGAGMTRFGRSEWPLMQLASVASLAALKHANLGGVPVDGVVVANMGAARINRQTALGSALVDQLALYPAAAESVENGPASGASAVKVGFQAIASGMADVVLVTGVERMRVVNGMEGTDFVASLSHPIAEYIYGVTLPSLAGLFARLFMEKHGVERKHLAMVAIKNHANAAKNPYAHIQQTITMEGILTLPEAVVNNPPIAEPLHMFDCCPVSDGAASLVLVSQEVAAKLKGPKVRLAGMGQATDTHTVHERKDPTDLKSVRIAAEQAFRRAGLKPEDVDVAELHDAFTILEIAESEASGFFPRGEGHKALERGDTQLGGRLPINPSGGLKAKGHPVGATGVAQLVELTWQLRGECGERQVKDAKIAYACNFGGFGNNVVASVLQREA
ncbi:acetyl-CoA acetyltransferase [Candidatus Bipolaricaulota bacterium]|nr:acetyl-CoA acetyltransferase [Candidatus Bipolaricaulota bacterium]TFH08599.1 MAG: acetyl-CoA acetyltransferase [Candidatus Atribacteria bacterium]